MTYDQAKTCGLIPKEWYILDLYANSQINERPIGGNLLYTDGFGNLFVINNDGSIKQLEA